MDEPVEHQPQAGRRESRGMTCGISDIGSDTNVPVRPGLDDRSTSTARVGALQARGNATGFRCEVHTIPHPWADWTGPRLGCPRRPMAQLLSPAPQPRLYEGRDGVEVVVATSARAVLLVAAADSEREAATARRIVTIVTRRALAEAPGLGVTGIVRPLASRQDLQAELVRAKAEIAAVR